MNNGIGTQFSSAIYTGTVRHRRFFPKKHEFSYSVFMMYLDTREIETIFSLGRCWSLKHFAPVQFKRSDFHIDEQHQDINSLPPIDEAVRNTIQMQTAIRPTGPIRMLVNLRYWGYNMNPLSTYYCFDEKDESIVAILAEVHNTPWNERHSYVLLNEGISKKQNFSFEKEFHVSPFNPLTMSYEWFSTTPDKILAIHLENWKDNKKIMDASMMLVREKLTKKSINLIPIRYPWMTVKIILAIYWQAIKLWYKGVPIFNHQEKSTPSPKKSQPLPINTKGKMNDPMNEASSL